MTVMSGSYFSGELDGFPTLGKERSTAVDKLVALLLATAPLLQHYRGVSVFHAGILVLILCLPYLCIRLLCTRRLPWKNLVFALPLVLFQVYRVLAHGADFLEIMQGVVMCAYFIAFVLGGINVRYFALSASIIALAAGLLVTLQTIVFYLFDVHLQLVATEFLLEQSMTWVALAKTGFVGINNIASPVYRPSAFFLEPSHMLVYSMPVLFLLLLTPKMTRTKRISAVILSLGLMLSTSGMGILLVFGAWLLQLGFSNGRENRLAFRNLFRWKNISHCLLFLAIFAALCFALPALRYAILRIFLNNAQISSVMPQQQILDTPGINPQSSTAIEGRTELPLLYIRQMQGWQLWHGLGDVLPAAFDFPIGGFFATIFKYGIIGTAISYLFYLLAIFYTKHAYRWMAILLLPLSLVDAHTHGMFYMLFYTLFLTEGCLCRMYAAPPEPQGTNMEGA